MAASAEIQSSDVIQDPQIDFTYTLGVTPEIGLLMFSGAENYNSVTLSGARWGWGPIEGVVDNGCFYSGSSDNRTSDVNSSESWAATACMWVGKSATARSRDGFSECSVYGLNQISILQDESGAGGGNIYDEASYVGHMLALAGITAERFNVPNLGTGAQTIDSGLTFEPDAALFFPMYQSSAQTSMTNCRDHLHGGLGLVENTDRANPKQRAMVMYGEHDTESDNSITLVNDRVGILLTGVGQTKTRSLDVDFKVNGMDVTVEAAQNWAFWGIGFKANDGEVFRVHDITTPLTNGSDVVLDCGGTHVATILVASNVAASNEANYASVIPTQGATGGSIGLSLITNDTEKCVTATIEFGASSGTCSNTTHDKVMQLYSHNRIQTFEVEGPSGLGSAVGNNLTLRFVQTDTGTQRRWYALTIANEAAVGGPAIQPPHYHHRHHNLAG